jgi:hypothetical protein
MPKTAPTKKPTKPHWNYRVCKERFHYKLGKRRRVEVCYSLREVHYDKNGKVVGWSSEPTTIVGDSRKDVIWGLSTALGDATGKPVLWIGNTRKEK